MHIEFTIGWPVLIIVGLVLAVLIGYWFGSSNSDEW